MGDVRSMIRVGIVSDVDEKKRLLRVYYPDMSNMVSDWLQVLTYPRLKFRIKGGSHTHDGGEHTHEGVGGTGSHEHSGGEHTHTWDDVEVYEWFPKVDDKVLVVYAYGFNSEGFVLGVLPP